MKIRIRDMNNQHIFRIFVIVLAISAANILPAQNQTETGQGHNEQVTIISSYDPSINQAFKINQSPTEMQFNLDKPEFSFETIKIDQPTQITLNPIVPVVINADKRTYLTQNSLKAGIGSLFSPYLDFFHSSGQKNDYRFDAHIHHLSSFKNIADYSPSPESKTNLNLNYRKFLKYHIIDVGIYYSLKTNRYYGFKPDDFPAFTIDDSRLKQMYNLARVNMALSSNYRNNKKLNHKINLDAYYYFDKYQTTEINANVDFDVHKSFEVSNLLNYQELGLSGKVNYFQNTDSINSSDDVLVSLTPYFKANYGILNFNIGLNFNLLNTDKTNFYFYPILDLNVNLIPKVLTVFAGLDGNVEKNSFLMLSELNPWVSSTIPITWDHTFKAYGGIRGNIAQKVNFSVQVSWQKFNNMFFFVNVPDATTFNYLVAIPFNKFSTIHDKGSVFGVSGELTFAASQKVNIMLGAVYNSYTLDSLDSPYHKPTSKIKLGASFLTTKKLRIWTDIYYYGKRTALDLSILPNTKIDLEAFIDLNVGVDYQLTDQFSVFLSLTNLLNQHYERYYNYPVQGIQIMGGIMYKF
jgi:hypothetical protein